MVSAIPILYDDDDHDGYDDYAGDDLTPSSCLPCLLDSPNHRRQRRTARS